MKERPILFNSEMVNAILDGRKCLARRIINPQPDCVTPKTNNPVWLEVSHGKYIKCRYGRPGDKLWVRETFCVESNHQIEFEDYRPPFNDGRPVRLVGDNWEQCHYRATDPCPELVYDDDAFGSCKWKPSIHMPRWASRILLEVVNVRVERLNDISDEDAIAEGMKAITKDGGITIKYGIPDRDGLPGNDNIGWVWQEWRANPIDAYKKLWESINGQGSWDLNPWVWVVEFIVIEPSRQSCK